MATNSYSTISQRTTAYAAVKMLEHAMPTIVLGLFGDSKPLPPNKADTMKFRRRVPRPAANIPLAEGVTPTAQQLQFVDVTVQIKQWGGLFVITDAVDDLCEDPVINEASQECGEQAGRTLEAVTYGVLRAGTNVAYANGSARTDVNTPLSLNKQRAVIRTLQANKADKITSILAPGPNFATKAVEASYVAIGHTDLAPDIRNLAGFTPVAEYGSRQPLCPEEVGSVEDVRYILSADLPPWADAGGAKAGASGTMMSTSGTSADVYPILFIGKHAYGQVPLKGKGSIVPSIIPPGQQDKSDPLGQRGYVGWKGYFNAVVLNDAWMVRLEVAATAL